MIEINLLPPELKRRPKSKFQLPQLPKKNFLHIGVGAVAFFISIYFLLGIITGLRHHRLNVLGKRWADIRPQKDEADKVKAQLAKLRNEIQAIEALVKRDFLWSQKLNQLSNLIVPRVWLTSLSVAARLRREGKTEKLERVMVISGNVVSQGADEATYVGRFMSGLNQDEGFFRDFSKIELKSIQRKRIGASEVADFVLECSFK